MTGLPCVALCSHYTLWDFPSGLEWLAMTPNEKLPGRPLEASRCEVACGTCHELRKLACFAKSQRCEGSGGGVAWYGLGRCRDAAAAADTPRAGDSRSGGSDLRT